MADQKLKSNRKDLQIANNSYNEGNIYLEYNGNEFWRQAVKCYTEAIRSCPFPNTIQSDDIKVKNLLANCYQKRSQAFALLGETENALYDQIQSQYLFNNVDYPYNDSDHQRVSHEWKAIESETYENMYLNTVPNKGRCFQALQDIEVGEYVLTERPLAAVLDDSQLRNYCSYCFKRADICFWPCRDCTEVVFCSRECERIAFNTYHRYECGIAALLDSTIHGYLAYRLVTVVGCDVALKLNRELLNRQLTADWIVSTESKSVDLMVAYKAFITLYDHLDCVDTKTQCSELAHCIFLAFYIQYKNAFAIEMRRESDDSYNERDLSVSFVELVLMLHSHINSFLFKDKYRIGSAIMYLGSIFSHSCDNVDYNWVNGCLLFSANTEILGAEELTITYGPDSQTRGGVLKRRKKLREEYNFWCGCPLCLSEYPIAIGFMCLACNGVIDYNESTKQGECLSCHAITDNFDTTIGRIEAIKSEIELLLDELLTTEDKDHCVKEISKHLTKLKKRYLHETSAFIVETTESVSRFCADGERYDLAFNLSLITYIKGDRPEDYTRESFDRLIDLTQYCGLYLDNFEIDDINERQNVWKFRLALYDLIIEIIRYRRRVADNEELKEREKFWIQIKMSTIESMNRSLGLK